jgi:hypothetical protein
MTCTPTQRSASFKRGSTFAGGATYTPPAGGPANLNSVTIESDVVDSAGNTYSLSVVKTGNLTFTLSYQDTTGWAIGQAKWDIKFINAGVVFYSDTMRLNISEQVTV